MTVDLRGLQEKNVNDYLAGLKTSDPASVDASRAEIGASRGKFLQNFGNVAQNVGAKYGLQQDIAGTAPEAIAPQVQDLNRTSESTLNARTQNDSKTRANMVYQQAYDRFVNAGVDRQQADNYARQLAMDSLTREFQAGQNESARQVELKKQDILDATQNQMNALNKNYADNANHQLLKNSVIRQLSGLAGIGIGAWAAPHLTAAKIAAPVVAKTFMGGGVPNEPNYSGIGPEQDMGYYPAGNSGPIIRR